MKLTKKEQYMEKKIAIVRLHRGVLDPITQVNKLMTFICDIEDLKKGDFVVVELSMKTRAKNFNNDFRVGRVEDFMIFRDGEIAQYRPNNFVVFKINDNDFYMRCNTLLKKSGHCGLDIELSKTKITRILDTVFLMTSLKKQTVCNFNA